MSVGVEWEWGRNKGIVEGLYHMAVDAVGGRDRHRKKFGKMNTVIASPCLDCPDRHLGCHDHCERYQAYKTQLAEYKQMRRRKLSKEHQGTKWTQTRYRKIKD